MFETYLKIKLKHNIMIDTFSKNFSSIYLTAIEFNKLQTEVIVLKPKAVSKPKVYLPNGILSNILSFHSCPKIQHKREFKCCLSKIRQFHSCNTELQTAYQIEKHLYSFRRKHFLRHFKKFHLVADPCNYDFKEVDFENNLIEEKIQEGKGRRWRDIDEWRLNYYYDTVKKEFNTYSNILFIDNGNKKGIEVYLDIEMETEFYIKIHNETPNEFNILHHNERYNIHYKKKPLPIHKMTTSKDGTITMEIDEGSSCDNAKRRIKFNR